MSRRPQPPKRRPLTRPIPPEQVAAAVVRVLRKGHRQAVVPGHLSAGSALWQLFPRPAATAMRRWIGLDRVFLDVGADRAAYERRIAAGGTGNDRAAE